MRLSYVIVTRNRQDSLLKTLGILEQNTRLPRYAWEAVVVDNASDDGSAEAVRREFRDATVIRLDENEGMPGRNHGFKVAKGRYVCLIDDDSYPIGEAIPDALHHLDRHADTAAVVARVVNPGGTVEAPAMPCVLLGGASVIRKSVLDKLGGFSPEFFRQAEEYDLSFRFLAAGLRIERFEDVEFLHEKVPTGGRSSALVHRMDLRNNLIVAERFLPKGLRGDYRHDWTRRYASFAVADGHEDVVKGAMHEARVWARREQQVGRRTMSPAGLEAALSLKAQAKAIAGWAETTGARRVGIADFSKNLYATYAGVLAAGLEPVALIDPRPAVVGQTHRRMPIVDVATAADMGIDGVVVSNVNPAQVGKIERAVKAGFDGPVLTLWEPRFLNGKAPAPKADVQAA
jgi:GT2 family glycosyltransferase